MTLVAKIDGVTLPDGALLIGGPNSDLPGGIQGLPTSAWYGEAPQGGLQLDDPDGDLDSIVTLEGLHTFTVDETACVGNERIWSGWLTARRVSRGPYRDGPSRVWDCDIIDINWAFALMVFRASSAKRPAETDLARVAFGLASAPMAYTPVMDNGRFNVTDNPVNFEEADYVTKYPIELFASVAGTSGKNFYAYLDQATGEISMHYDLVGVGPTSTLAISNVIADSDSTTFYPFRDGSLERSPAYKVTGILFAFKGDYAYGIRQATIDELGASIFSPTGLQRDEVYTSDRVGKLTTAQALIERMLEERAIDRDTISTMIRVPASQVNLVVAGDLIDAKYTHLPGYEAGGLLPVIRRNVVPTPGRTDMYDIHLELTAAAKPTGPGGGDPNNFPPTPTTCSVDDFLVIETSDGYSGIGGGDGVLVLDSAPSLGNLLVAIAEWEVGGNSITNIDGFTSTTLVAVAPTQQNFAMQIWYRVVEVGDGTTFSVTGTGNGGRKAVRVLEYAGGLTVFDSFDSTEVTANNSASFDMGTVTPPAGSTALIFSAVVPSLNVTDTFSGVPDGSLVEDIDFGPNGSRLYIWAGHTLVSSASGSYNPTVTPTHGGIMRGYGAASLVFTCAAADPDAVCISAGQPSPVDEAATPSTGDGTTTTFETRCPFADETLHVKVDNLNQDAAVTSYDGAAGTFTLGFAPVAGEQVTVNYLGR